MTFTFASKDEARSTAHHLRVAAMRYRQNAEDVCHRGVAENFRKRAVQADKIADQITKRADA